MPAMPTNEPLTITILVAPTTSHPSLHAAHGLAVLLDHAGCRILVDTGPSYRVLMHNAQALGIDLSTITHVVLTSWSKTSTAGLPALPRPGPTVLHPPGPEPRIRRLGLATKPVTRPTTPCPGATIHGPLQGEKDKPTLALDAAGTVLLYGCECPSQPLPARPIILGKRCPTTRATLLDCTYTREGPAGAYCRLPAGTTLTILNPPLGRA